MTARIALLLAMLTFPLCLARGVLAFDAALRRARRARRRRAVVGRMLRELPAFAASAPLALLAGAGALGTLGATGPGVPIERLLTSVGLASISGCAAWWGLRAGRLEARGAWRPARRLARGAGLSMLAGLLPMGALTLLSFVQASAESHVDRGAALLALIALLAFSVAAVVSLLCGLAAKPRPGQTLAAAAHLAGLVALVAT
jgi:hypothetical protein